MKLIYLKSALKCDSFDVAIVLKIPFFRVLVSIEPGRSLLQFVTNELFEKKTLSDNLLCLLTLCAPGPGPSGPTGKSGPAYVGQLLEDLYYLL